MFIASVRPSVRLSVCLKPKFGRLKTKFDDDAGSANRMWGGSAKRPPKTKFGPTFYVFYWNFYSRYRSWLFERDSSSIGITMKTVSTGEIEIKGSMSKRECSLYSTPADSGLKKLRCKKLSSVPPRTDTSCVFRNDWARNVSYVCTNVHVRVRMYVYVRATIFCLKFNTRQKVLVQDPR